MIKVLLLCINFVFANCCNYCIPARAPENPNPEVITMKCKYDYSPCSYSGESGLVCEYTCTTNNKTVESVCRCSGGVFSPSKIELPCPCPLLNFDCHLHYLFNK